MDWNDHRRLTILSAAISRRTALRGISGAGLAAAVGFAAHDRVTAQSAATTPAIEPDAGLGTSWVLTSGDQLRPAAPPDAAATPELADLEAIAADRTPATLDRISY